MKGYHDSLISFGDFAKLKLSVNILSWITTKKRKRPLMPGIEL